MLTPVQFFNALNVDATGPVAFNFRAHANEHFGQVRDFRLLGGVFQNSFAFSQSGCHQKVFCACDSHHVGGNARAFETRAAIDQTGHHITVLYIDLRTHGLQTFDVLVDRARPNGTATRQRNACLAKPGQQGAQRQHRSAHGFDHFVRGFRFVQRTRIQTNGAIFFMCASHAHVANEFEHGADVLQLRHVAQHHFLIG